MATDAKFDRIQEILPHDNSDNLEIAMISNFPCIVRKADNFKKGDWVFYIRDDARLVCFDEYKDYNENHNGLNGEFVTQDCFTASIPWQTNLMKYLGSNGRVKTIKLRRKLSMGIVLKPNIVLEDMHVFDGLATSEDGYLKINELIASENGTDYLRKNFGVEHWVAPITGCTMGRLDVRGPLFGGVRKSDEENFENIDDSEFPWGEDVLETMKLDGSSCTILSTPDGDVHIMSRSLDLRLDCDNVYIRATRDIVPLVSELAKIYNKTIAIRGEVCGQGINANKVNKEAKDPNLSFNMYGVNFPGDDDYCARIGLWGTPYHFLEVNKVLKEHTGHEIKTVPVLGVVKLTKEYLQKVTEMPASEKEGSVFNTKSMELPHFKAKSREYLLSVG